jgi:S-formylglutathione hydrolase FrmB
MVEYWCWEQEMADWYARQPMRRHRDFAGWIVEGRVLFDRLDELKQLARKCLQR